MLLKRRQKPSCLSQNRDETNYMAGRDALSFAKKSTVGSNGWVFATLAGKLMKFSTARARELLLINFRLFGSGRVLLGVFEWWLLPDRNAIVVLDFVWFFFVDGDLGCFWIKSDWRHCGFFYLKMHV